MSLKIPDMLTKSAAVAKMGAQQETRQAVIVNEYDLLVNFTEGHLVASPNAAKC